MRGILFLSFLAFLFLGIGSSFPGTKKINNEVFINLTSWAVQFFDRNHFNVSKMIKGASRGLGSVSMDIYCENGKDFFYLLIKKGPAVKNVGRRYRIAAADYFGKNVCEKGVIYRLIASFSSKNIYSDPITGAKCGEYYYNLCLYMYKKGRLEAYRCFEHQDPIDYCFKRR